MPDTILKAAAAKPRDVAAQLIVTTDERTGEIIAAVPLKPKKRRDPNPPSYALMIYNKLFCDESNACIRAVRFKNPVPCAQCGRELCNHWTSVVPFRALTLDDGSQPNPMVIDTEIGAIHPPLTPVCDRHLLSDQPEVMAEIVRALRYFAHLDYNNRLKREQAAAKPKPARSHL